MNKDDPPFKATQTLAIPMHGIQPSRAISGNRTGSQTAGDREWLENARRQFCPRFETHTDKVIDEWLQWIAK